MGSKPNILNNEEPSVYFNQKNPKNDENSKDFISTKNDITQINPKIHDYKDLDNDIEEEKERISQINDEESERIDNFFQGKTPFRRWGKEKDKHAYQMLENICKDRNMFFCDFINVDPLEVIDNDKREFISDFYNNIFEDIAIRFGWMRRPIHLFLRFQKIYFKNTQFSVRELKYLRKIVIKNKSKDINYNQIMFHYPGKSIEAIKDKVE